MWTAVKLEQAAQNKGMDLNSEEFMQKIASGAHTLRLQLADYGEVTAAIIVI